MRIPGARREAPIGVSDLGFVASRVVHPIFRRHIRTVTMGLAITFGGKQETLGVANRVVNKEPSDVAALFLGAAGVLGVKSGVAALFLGAARVHDVENTIAGRVTWVVTRTPQVPQCGDLCASR